MKYVFRRLFYAAIVVAVWPSLSDAQLVDKVYEMPSGTKIDAWGHLFDVISITQFTGGHAGAIPPTSGRVDTVDLTVLSKYWSPGSLEEYRELLMGDSLKRVPEGKAFTEMKDQRGELEFRMTYMCRLRDSDINYALVRYFCLDGDGKYAGDYFLDLQEDEGEWKISKLAWAIDRLKEPLYPIQPVALAYLLSGDASILQDSGFSSSDIEKMAGHRSNITNADSHVLLENLIYFVNEVRSGYRHQDLYDQLIITQPVEWINELYKPKRLVFDASTLVKMNSDLKDIDPKLRTLVIEKLQARGPMRAMGLLSDFTTMSRPEIRELVGSWTSIDHLLHNN